MQIRIQIMPFPTIESSRSYSLRPGLLLYLFFFFTYPIESAFHTDADPDIASTGNRAGGLLTNVEVLESKMKSRSDLVLRVCM